MGSQSRIESAAEWEVVVAKGSEEIEAVRPIWEAMQRNESCPVPNTDIDRFLAAAEQQKGAVQPCIILLEHDGRPKALVVGRIEKLRVKCAIGYGALFNPSVCGFTIVYGGILGERGSDVCVVLIEKFMDMLARGEIDVVFLNHIATDSLIYKYATKMPNAFCRDHFPVQRLHWKSSLPDSYEEFLRSRSKNTRHNIRRYQSRLVSKYGDRLSVKCFTEKSQIDRLFKDTVEVARKTYQHGLGSAFVDDEETRNRVGVFIDRKLLAAYVLYIDDKPCAFWNGVRYGKTFFTWTTGYDPAFQNDRLGFVLLVRVIEALCEDRNVDSIDFGFGDAQYKQNLCDISWAEATAYIFAPRLYPILVNILHGSTTAVDLGLKRALNKLGAVGWIKRRWRNVLQDDRKN